MKEKTMPIPKILDYPDNIYKQTNAVIKRSNQVTKMGSEDVETYRGKPISLSMDEILNRKVLFRNKD
ncbi:MAG: DNA-directed RNA polymerase subunit omega [Spirochaetota bacterium]